MSLVNTRNIEILGGNLNFKDMHAETLIAEAPYTIQTCKMQWTEQEQKMLEMIEKKLQWYMQPDNAKEQKIALGFITLDFFEKWIWGQLGSTEKHSDRFRKWMINGEKKDVEFLCFEFVGDSMVSMVNDDWQWKEWKKVDKVTGETRKYRAHLYRLQLTYNTYLEWLDARIEFTLETKVKGLWYNV